MLGSQTEQEWSSSSVQQTEGAIYGVGDVENSGTDTSSSQVLMETTNLLSGDYQLSEQSGDRISGWDQTVDGGVVTEQVESITDSGSVSQIGNDYSGQYTLEQTSGSTVSFTQVQSNGVSELTLQDVSISSVQARETGNVDTGLATQEATLWGTNSLSESGTDGQGQWLSVVEEQGWTASRVQWSNDATGDYELYQTGVTTTEQWNQGVNQTGYYSVYEGTSVTSQEVESGNDVSGAYSQGEYEINSYTLQQTDSNSGGNYVYKRAGDEYRDAGGGRLCDAGSGLDVGIGVG